MEGIGLCCRSKQIPWDNFKRKTYLKGSVCRFIFLHLKNPEYSLHVCNFSYWGGWVQGSQRRLSEALSSSYNRKRKQNNPREHSELMSAAAISRETLGSLYNGHSFSSSERWVNLEYACKQDFIRCVWRKRGGKEEVGEGPSCVERPRGGTRIG